MDTSPTNTSAFVSQSRPRSLDLDPKSGRRKSSTCWMDLDQEVNMYTSAQEVITYSQESVYPSDWILDEGEDTVAKVYAFLKNYLSSSELSNESLDVCIEHAMDLVKVLLKNSVKNEFDKYQEKIVYLEEFAAKLRSENDSLRPHVDQHVLLQYQQQQQQQKQPLLSQPQQDCNMELKQQQQQQQQQHQQQLQLQDQQQKQLLIQQKLHAQHRQQQHIKQQLQLQQQLQAKEHQKCHFENFLADSNDQQLIIDGDDSAQFDYSPSQAILNQTAKVKTSI